MTTRPRSVLVIFERLVFMIHVNKDPPIRNRRTNVCDVDCQINMLPLFDMSARNVMTELIV